MFARRRLEPPEFNSKHARQNVGLADLHAYRLQFLSLRLWGLLCFQVGRIPFNLNQLWRYRYSYSKNIFVFRLFNEDIFVW